MHQQDVGAFWESIFAKSSFACFVLDGSVSRCSGLQKANSSISLPLSLLPSAMRPISCQADHATLMLDCEGGFENIFGIRCGEGQLEVAVVDHDLVSEGSLQSDCISSDESKQMFCWLRPPKWFRNEALEVLSLEKVLNP